MDGNQITDRFTDNSAGFDVGLWFRDNDDVSLENVAIVGYWKEYGLLLDGSGRDSDIPGLWYGGMEIGSFLNCRFQGKVGCAILGSDEGEPSSLSSHTQPTDDAAGEGLWGMSHLWFTNCMFHAYDHHGNGFVSNWDPRNLISGGTALKIDGYVANRNPQRINNIRLCNCSIHTRDEYGAYIDRASNIHFVNVRCEARPIFVTQRALNVTFLGCELPYVVGYKLSRIFVDNPGSGYSSSPTVTISGGSGNGATATAHLEHGKVRWIEIVKKGDGYRFRPTVTVSGGGGTGAIAHALIDADYRSAESSAGFYSSPPFRRRGGHLRRLWREFVIEFRHSNGTIQHRLGSTAGGQRSNTVERLFRFAIEKSGWDYTSWVNTPQPDSTDPDDLSKGIFLGPKGVTTKSCIHTVIPQDSTDHDDEKYHQVFGEVVRDDRQGVEDVKVVPGTYSAQEVNERLSSFRTCLRLQVRKNDGAEVTSIAGLADGETILIRIRGLLYEQVWGF